MWILAVKDNAITAKQSVLKGFKKEEWKKLLKEAGIEKYSVNWKWAFRYLVVVKKQGHESNINRRIKEKNMNRHG